MLIIDCFIFYNELELLTYRLNTLYHVVDYFVIVESTRTFVGKEKTLFFNENKQWYEQFASKIIHIIVDDFPCIENLSRNDVWRNENFQRDAISRGISQINELRGLANEDIFTISDADEIPNPNIFTQIKCGNIPVNINTLQMDIFYYNLNYRFRHKWNSVKILTYGKYREMNISCNDIRHLPAPFIYCGGWHLSYFGNSAFIQNKIQNFSHQEFNHPMFTDIANIEERVSNSRDLFGREFDVEPGTYKDKDNLPENYEIYLSQYL